MKWSYGVCCPDDHDIHFPKSMNVKVFRAAFHYSRRWDRELILIYVLRILHILFYFLLYPFP